MFFILLWRPWGGAHVFGQVVFSDPENWQAHIHLEFSAETLVREPELDQKLHKMIASTDRGPSLAFHLTRHYPSPEGQGYTLSLAGSGGVNQLKKMLSLAADPTRLPGEGPLALELSGKIRSGESLPLSLESNPSTGFIWEISSLDQQKIRQREGTALRAKSRLLGAPMTQTVVLEGLNDGETTIQLTYRRPWLKDQPVTRKTKIQLTDLSLAADPGQPDPALQALFEEPAPSGSGEPDQPLLQLAGTFDWRNLNGQNYLPPVRNQGSCGSCWAFGTVAPLEAALKIKQGLTVDLSEQYLISCSFNESYDYGCNGGWFAHQYHQWKIPPGESAVGAVREADYPYSGKDTACTTPHTHPQKITSWSYVNPANPYGIPAESAIKNAIVTYGAVAAAVCVGPAFQNYQSGIFATDEKYACGSGGVNHAIALVGWDDASDTWIMRNSWGPYWGEAGYMHIKRTVSNIGYAANYVVYDPPSPPAQFTPTHWAYLPTVQNSKRTCQAPLCNGDFEGGVDGAWSESSVKGWELILNLTADYSSLGLFNHQGNYAAWLGGDSSESSVISQQVTIPASATHLGYWYWIDSPDSCGFDFAYVELGGTRLKTYDLCYTRDTGGWVYETLDISAQRGLTRELSFKVTTDSDPDFISNLFLDDIAFVSGTGQPPLSRIDPPRLSSTYPPSGEIRRKTNQGSR